MEFNSIEYIVFLAVIFILFQLMKQKVRLPLLLAASYFFYGCWNIKYTFLIISVTLISYISALCIEKYEEKKKNILLFSLIVFISFLFVFKYFDFFGNIFNYLMKVNKSEIRISNLSLLLPVGISFYTFQAISYVIDVYRADCKAEKSLLKYALYIAFFPQLVAGPIERANNIIPQFDRKYEFNYRQITDGMILIAWGMFKKMVIADELAVYVDKIYGKVVSYTGFALIIATIMFAVQIYCDFSGYSDIAVGSAKLFGIDLMKNFEAPYLSSSLQEFWTRWHISLSQWLKDYVYIPLGGGRKGKIRANFNLLCTFLVSGLWHGADIKFVIWGGYLV